MPPKQNNRGNGRPKNDGKPGEGGGGGGSGGRQRQQRQQRNQSENRQQPPPPGFGAASGGGGGGPSDDNNKFSRNVFAHVMSMSSAPASASDGPPPLVDDGGTDGDGGGDEIAPPADGLLPIQPPTTATATADASAFGDHAHCVICYADDLPRHRTIAPCGHDDVCGPCHLRLRSLHADRRCPVCKSVNDRVIVDTDPPTRRASEDMSDLDEESRTHRPFASYELWGDELGSGYTHREDCGMFFRTEYYATDVLPLFSLSCNVPGCDFTNETDTYKTESKFDPQRPNAKQKREVKRLGGMKALNDHLRTKHGTALCHLCVTAKRDFVSLLPRFTPTQLKVHQGRGDGAGSGFAGHPLCEFCRPRRFYDLTKLHEHLNKDHYKCHVCEKQGRPNQFFKNYGTLSRHFDREHFLCHDSQCLAARFVVFENEIDLRAHERNVHGGGTAGGGGSTKINLEFRYRRGGADGDDGIGDQEAPREEDFQYGLDGEAFVPEALPQQENEPEISHPQHAERTAALRAEAAQVREAQRLRERAEAFPTLGAGEAGSAAEGGGAGGGGGGGDGRGIVGWTAEGRAGMGRRGKATMTQEDFPALPTTHAASSVAARARRGRGVGRPTPSVAAAPTVSWSSSSTPALASARPGAAARAPIQPPTVPATSYAAGGVATPMNSQANLRAENFPSLGAPSGGGKASSARASSSGLKYAAAEALARKLAKKQPQQQQRGAASMTSSDFPSLSAASSKKAAPPKAKPPSKEALDNVMHFPPPPSLASANDSLATGKATVEDMKVALGTANYKKLKALTKDFAAGTINPDTYVDMAAALFDDGIRDQDLWSFLPSLIQSCPNEESSARAMKYLEKLRLASDMQERQYANSTTNGSHMQQPGYASAASAAVVANRTAASSSASAVPYGAQVVPGKKKNSWGGSGGASAVVRAKAPLGSVAALAAAQDAPQAGTATKYMAKEKAEERKKKQVESQLKQSGGNESKQSKKAKQKKKNEELRNLAFGGK